MDMTDEEMTEFWEDYKRRISECTTDAERDTVANTMQQEYNERGDQQVRIIDNKDGTADLVCFSKWVRMKY
jgi:hypothetical protein